MSILFLNSSPEKQGNTAALAAALLTGKDYETVTLADYRINSFGQTLPGDQFRELVEKMKAADTIVIGSPVYWHNLSGALRVFLDRFYGAVEREELEGRRLVFLFQGAAPEKWMLEAGEYTISRFAALYGMRYLGMATNRREAQALGKKL